MSAVIEEVEIIDSIDCRPDGTVAVRKSNCYKRTESAEEVDADGELVTNDVISYTPISVWRCVLEPNEVERAEEVLGNKKDVAITHWQSL